MTVGEVPGWHSLEIPVHVPQKNRKTHKIPQVRPNPPLVGVEKRSPSGRAKQQWYLSLTGRGSRGRWDPVGPFPPRPSHVRPGGREGSARHLRKRRTSRKEASTRTKNTLNTNTGGHFQLADFVCEFGASRLPTPNPEPRSPVTCPHEKCQIRDRNPWPSRSKTSKRNV